MCKRKREFPAEKAAKTGRIDLSLDRRRRVWYDEIKIIENKRSPAMTLQSILSSTVVREPITKGWSSDKKYKITDSGGTSYLLRISAWFRLVLIIVGFPRVIRVLIMLYRQDTVN